MGEPKLIKVNLLWVGKRENTRTPSSVFFLSPPSSGFIRKHSKERALLTSAGWEELGEPAAAFVFLPPLGMPRCAPDAVRTVLKMSLAQLFSFRDSPVVRFCYSYSCLTSQRTMAAR